MSSKKIIFLILLEVLADPNYVFIYNNFNHWHESVVSRLPSNTNSQKHVNKCLFCAG